jgi:hypothetical protein
MLRPTDPGHNINEFKILLNSKSNGVLLIGAKVSQRETLTIHRQEERVVSLRLDIFTFRND